MRTFSISISDLQYQGLQKAQEIHNLEHPDNEDVVSPEAYAAFVLSRACDSYVSSLGVAEQETPEALKREIEARSISLSEKEAENLRLKEEIWALKESDVVPDAEVEEVKP